jgi:polar amino acid transport system substrate-binding protein
VLAEMGYEDIEPVVTDWGGLIPGLRAGRFDIITGGMYILESQCGNVLFSDPMGTFRDAFNVPAGNPMGLHNYEDLLANDATIVTGAGFNIVEVAKDAGIDDGKIMQVPGPTEILAAVRAGRADAGGVTYFTARNLADQSEGTVEVSDPSQMPEDTLNWVGIAFHPEHSAFAEALNAAMADYLGSDAMLEAVAEYGYTEAQLPGEGVTTEWVTSPSKSGHAC